MINSNSLNVGQKQTTEQPVNIPLPESTVEIVSLTVDSLVLVAALFLALARQKLMSTLRSFKVESQSKTPLDKNQHTKMHIHGNLTALRTVTDSDYACLGLLHNGSFTEWGYSFSSVTWELESTNSGLQPLIPKLKECTITNWLSTSETWFSTGDYVCFPIKLGSTQIGIIALSSFDNTKSPKVNTQDTQEIVSDIVETILATFIDKAT
jgi:hypothetical protein